MATDELQEMFEAAQRQFGARLPTEAPGWAAPTQSGGRTVAELVVHMIARHRWAAAALAGRAREEADRIADEHPSATRVAELPDAWEAAAEVSRSTAAAVEAESCRVELPSGARPASDYLSEVTVDAFLHAWDLGDALGLGLPLPDDLTDWVYGTVAGWDRDTWSEMFERPVTDTGEERVLDRIVVAAGRDLRR